jgi:hypothetical protein
MERIDARESSRPLHPQLLGRESAASPRASYKNLTIAVIDSLTNFQSQSLPAEKVFTGQHLTRFRSASSNGFKDSQFLRIVPPGITLERVPGHENRNLNPFHDAESKALSSARRKWVKEQPFSTNIERWFHLSRNRSTVSVDIVNQIPEVTQNEKITFKPLGKPEGQNEEEKLQTVRTQFASMAKDALENDWDQTFYAIHAVTRIHNRTRPERDAWATERIAVGLDPEKLQYIATPEGFQQYVDTVRDVGYDPTKIAGGLELWALVEMGVVTQITKDPSLVGEHQHSKLPDLRRAHAVALGQPNPELVTEYASRFPPTQKQKRLRQRSGLSF